MTGQRELDHMAERVLATCRKRGWTLATAESCTGGMIAAALTAIAGSSDVVDRGFVTYSNAAKAEMLDVPTALIETVGAVSREVAEAMARGALARSKADVAVSVTGIAGPGGGSDTKPVGLVHLASATRDGAVVWLERRYGPLSRDAVRHAAALDALELIERAAGSPDI